MKRMIWGLIWVLGLVPLAQAQKFQEGVHYVEIPFAEPLENGSRVEVREFFWYGCPHCYSLEPVLERWLKRKPRNVDFVRTPAFLPKRLVHAKAYYAFQSLENSDKLHAAFFRAYHEQGQRFASQAEVARWLAAQGVDAGKFDKAYSSFSVDHQVRLAQSLAGKYGINSVPTLVIEGRYLTTSTMAGGHEGVMRVVDYLVNRVASGK